MRIGAQAFEALGLDPQDWAPMAPEFFPTPNHNCVHGLNGDLYYMLLLRHLQNHFDYMVKWC